MKVGISPRLIINIALLYLELNRALLEYVDNIFDAAEAFYDKSQNEYTKNIHIKIHFSGNGYDTFEIRFEDNCTGISELASIIQSIGNSRKKYDLTTNGTYAFGLLVFVCMCERMVISTKVASSNTAESIVIKRETFYQDNVEDTNVDFEVGIPGSTKMIFSNDNTSAWTIVKLTDFDKDKHMQIDIDEFVSELEKHFEQLLNRGNLKVDVIYPNYKIHRCKPFKYDAYDGEIYQRTLTRLEYTACKKTSRKEIIDISKNPVTIFLKIINGKTVDRKPFFAINGRRVCDIADVKAFRTYSKTMLWSNDTLPGFISATGILEPTIARNTFKNTKLAKALFTTLLNVEEEIRKFVDENLKINVIGKYKLLESILKNALLEVAKEITKEKKSRNTNSKYEELESNEETDVCKTYLVKDRGEKENTSLNNRLSASTDMSKLNRKSRRFKKIDCPVESKVEHNDTKLTENQEDFLNPIIEFEKDPDRDHNNELLRSKINGNNIIVYAKHPEFDSRVDKARDGVPRISQKIIHYLSCELIKNFKIIEKYRKDLEDDNTLENYLSSLYSFEKKLQFLDGKKLSELK